MPKYSKAKMFNRKAAGKQSKAEEIIKNLNIKQGQTIADIGSGGGFFTLLFSQLVGTKGTVYAVDTNKELLEFITTQAKQQGAANIIPTLVTEHSVSLPPQSVDLVFVRNAYHHLQDRTIYFAQVKELLVPQGKVAIIEYLPQGSMLSFHRRRHHNVPKEIIISEMKKAGFMVSASFDFLPVQSFTIFTPVPGK
jgi:arsenite methyltransferase